MKEPLEIIKIETEVITYFIRDGILNMVVKSAVLTEDNLNKSLVILHDFYKGEKLLVLLNPMEGIAPNKEQRKQIIQAFCGITKAKAVVNQNLLTPLVINLMMKFEKTEFPMKMFKSEENAINWLNEFKLEIRSE